MRPRRLLGAEGVGAMALVVLLGGASAALGDDKSKPPGALPAKVTASWKMAGAEMGWTRVSAYCTPEFVEFDKGGQDGDVPTFRFRSWKKGALAKLPVPSTPFGLYFFYTQVTDVYH